MYINLFDSHVHSDNSPEGRDLVTALCSAAVDKGISGICVTDSCDMQEFEEQRYGKRLMYSCFAARKAQDGRKHQNGSVGDARSRRRSEHRGWEKNEERGPVDFDAERNGGEYRDRSDRHGGARHVKDRGERHEQIRRLFAKS